MTQEWGQDWHRSLLASAIGACALHNSYHRSLYICFCHRSLCASQELPSELADHLLPSELVTQELPSELVTRVTCASLPSDRAACPRQQLCSVSLSQKREGGGEKVSGDELSHNLPTWTPHCTVPRRTRKLGIEHPFGFQL